MNSLYFIKALIGTMLFFSGLGAMLTAQQRLVRLPKALVLRPRVQAEWHRRYGHIALGALWMNGALGLMLLVYPPVLKDIRGVSHSSVAGALAVVLLAKAYLARRRVRWGMRRMVVLGLAVFVLILAVNGLAGVHALYAHFPWQ